MKNWLIKILGGYTQDEYDTKPQDRGTPYKVAWHNGRRFQLMQDHKQITALYEYSQGGNRMVKKIWAVMNAMQTLALRLEIKR